MARLTAVLQVFRGRGRPATTWYWRLRGRNGEIVLASEGYSRRASALRAARRLKALMIEASDVIEIDG